MAPMEMRRAIESELRDSLCDDHGSRSAEVGGDEIEFSWRGGQVVVEKQNEDTGTTTTITFGVRVEIVDVEIEEPLSHD